MEKLSPQFLATCRRNNGRLLRGEQMTRIETFVDAAFAFAFTMLVISIDQIPRSPAELIELSKPMSFTFHRAFDKANNLRQNLEDVISCGCNSLLTAGQSSNVMDGISNLKKIIKLANNRIQILAGSGVNHENVEILYKIGIRNFHLSGSERGKDGILETKTTNIEKLKTKLIPIV